MLAKMITTVTCGLALCAAMTGCTVSSDDPPYDDPPVGSSYGTLTALWTLDGSDAPGLCSYYAIDRVDVVVVDDGGYSMTDAQPLCEDFGVSFDLPVDWYSTEVTLLDYDGYAVSDTVIVDARVQRDSETVIDVDFPDGAIF